MPDPFTPFIRKNPAIKELIKRFKLIPLRISKVDQTTHEKTNAITSTKSNAK